MLGECLAQKRQAGGCYPPGQSQEGQLLVFGEQGQHDRLMASGGHQEPPRLGQPCLERQPVCQAPGLPGGQLELVELQELLWLQQGSWEVLWPQEGRLELPALERQGQREQRQGCSLEAFWLQGGRLELRELVWLGRAQPQGSWEPLWPREGQPELVELQELVQQEQRGHQPGSGELLWLQQWQLELPLLV